MEEVEAAVQSANPRFRPWMVVAKKGNHKARKESVTIPEQNRADLGMNGQGSRFGPLMIVNENDEGIISNNTTIVQESRRQSTISPTTHVTMPKRITKNSSITKTFTNPTFNNNANNAPPSDPSTMKHKGILHAHAKPNHVPMHEVAARKKPSYPHKAISNDSFVPLPRAQTRRNTQL